MLFLGIDAGTQGVRAAVVTSRGETLAEAAYSYPVLNLARLPDRYEQSPRDWWQALCRVVRDCVRKLPRPEEIAAVSLCGTSGTILPLDEAGEPLGNAILYNDLRSAAKAAGLRERAPGLEPRLGYRIGASFSLPRMVWYREEEPKIYGKCRLFVHQADYLLGRLSGEFVTDSTNALKSGYNILAGEWPRELEEDLGLDREKLPRVLAPGETISRLCPAAAEELGLSPKTRVAAGATDAYAAVLAAGAVGPGDCVSVLGTTLVCKAVANRRILDPAGVGYPYPMPEGRWLIGGATNLGGRCVGELAGGDYRRLDAEAEKLIPTGVRCYPLYGRGERFPFSDPDAEPFFRGSIFGGRLYPALMEGEAYGERLCYERLEEQGCTLGPVVRATGGASRSPVWLKIRASILQKPMVVPEALTSAVGCAMMAAAEELGGLGAAARAMSRVKREVEPDPALTGPYEQLYRKFREECRAEYGI